MITRTSPGEVDHPASRGDDHEAEDDGDGGGEDHDDLLSPRLSTTATIPLTVMDHTNRYNNLLFSSHKISTGCSTSHHYWDHI